MNNPYCTCSTLMYFDGSGRMPEFAQCDGCKAGLEARTIVATRTQWKEIERLLGQTAVAGLDRNAGAAT